MLLACHAHTEYQSFLRQHLPPLYHQDPKRVESFGDHLTALWFLDLDAAIPELLSRYSTIGRPAVDPITLLRSLLLMTMLRKVFSITEGVTSLRNDRILAVMSGFVPGNSPAVGTFYGFLNRFWLAFCHCSQEKRLHLIAMKRKPRNKKAKKFKKGEKLPNKRPGVVARMVHQVLRGCRLAKRPERFLQFVFARCVVDQSIRMGLVPTKPGPQPGVLSLVAGIAGDDTAVKAAATPSGIRVCDCRNKGIYQCDCPRRFSDPQANWGWDSHNEVFFTAGIFIH